MINPTWLRTFETLSEERHFTRTARRLNMTQPGVTQHLKKLEQQVGHPLFTRQGQDMMLTPQGKAVLAYARRQADEETALLESLAIDRADAGQVGFACSGSLALLLYPAITERLASAPELQVMLEAAPEDAIIKGVLEGRFDFGISIGQPTHFQLVSQALGRDQLCLLISAQSEQPMTFAMLQDMGLIRHPDADAYADRVLSRNFPEEYSGASDLSVRSYINQINQILDPVSQGLGYTILPWSGYQAYRNKERLRSVHLRVRVDQDLWLVQRKGRTSPLCVKAIADLCRQVLTQSLQASSMT